MHFNAALAVLAASCPAVLAAPSCAPIDTAVLRLVKTSESDPGQWVKEEDKFKLFTSKGIGFIDITDIKVSHPGGV